MSLTKKRKFREEFSFLSQPNCPPELKLLAADKISAYHNYTTAHASLLDCTNLDEQFKTVKHLVESFIENRQIFEEFRYYQQHNHVLGVHPVFKEYQELRALRALSDIELYKEKERIEHNIWRIQRQLDRNEKPHLRIDREQSIATKQSQLSEILRLIPSS